MQRPVNALTSDNSQISATSEQLWTALYQARSAQQPRTLAHVEDALFRHYLPMARSIADLSALEHQDRDGRRQAAEVGLAQAILSWRDRAPAEFKQFAGAAIAAQLRRHDALLAGSPLPGGGEFADEDPR
jgi:hypothetical protein